ncbi:MAG: alpha-amylase [Candidatus Pseudobacter hemicellulosilyticus]|uniref:Alpha-amylase n=1 Tax=Candidatus Pseudobacter hemicellulosilyticus TaxID=3121375 RepID=A0AAJ5WPS3_9BACT|nr:MAG: alpha-amylase [Pseudobacter sp.]
MNNPSLFQFFHWYYPDDGNLWNHCASQAEHLAWLGVTHVWLPPAYKAAWGSNDPGYAVYDIFDLGEFDQKATVRTKYGTKDQYLDCIKALHQHGLQAIADIVLNHKHGADETEEMTAREVNPLNRTEMALDTSQIRAHTKFTFPGRGDKYSSFVWDKHSFTGVSETMGDELKIYLIEHKDTANNWNEMMDDEMGNFDYLMGADIEFRNNFVREELKYWGKWYVETTGIDGFRLDAVKHINYRFFQEWLHYMRDTFQKEFFCVAEYWSGSKEPIINYCNALEQMTQVFDVPLHYNFYKASMEKKDYDLRSIWDGTVIRDLPTHAVTFVDNHDSQPFQSLESFVEYWFKPLAYALILLRVDGFPCIFFPALYGANYDEQRGEENFRVELAPIPALDKMMKARQLLAYGEQYDYFDHPNTVAWVRKGEADKEHSGCAVVMSNGDDGDKTMDMGEAFANTVFVDITGNIPDNITTNEHGQASFRCRGEAVSVWVKEAAVPLLG